MKKKRMLFSGISLFMILMVFVFVWKAKKTAGEEQKAAWKISMSADYPVAQSLTEMTAAADVVVSGQYRGLDSTWTMARNPENIQQEDETYYMEGYRYRFEVEEILKGTVEEKEILVNQKHSTTLSVRSAVSDMDGTVIAENPLFIEPEEDKTYILFLNYDAEFDNYYGATEPFSVLCRDDGTAKLQSNLIDHNGIFVQEALFGETEPVQILMEAPALSDAISGRPAEEIREEIAEQSLR